MSDQRSRAERAAAQVELAREMLERADELDDGALQGRITALVAASVAAQHAAWELREVRRQSALAQIVHSAVDLVTTVTDERLHDAIAEIDEPRDG